MVSLTYKKQNENDLIIVVQLCFLLTCIHQQAIAIGIIKIKTCQVTSAITATIPRSCIVVDAKPPSRKGISRSTTL